LKIGLLLRDFQGKYKMWGIGIRYSGIGNGSWIMDHGLLVNREEE